MTPSGAGGPGGDQPPDYADNNRWKQRGEPNPRDRADAEAAAARIGPELGRLRTARDFAPASTRRVLVGLGFAEPAVEVTGMRAAADGSTPPGAVYAVHVGGTACVIGDVRPERVLVQVVGVAAEYGCLEPFSH